MTERFIHQGSQTGRLYTFFKKHRLYRLAAETVALKIPDSTNREDVEAVDELLQVATMTSERTKKRLAVKIRRNAASGNQYLQARIEAFSGIPLNDPEQMKSLGQEDRNNSEEIRDIKAGTFTPWK